jgi:deoxyhypusine synthase
MKKVKDFLWTENITVEKLVDNYENIGFQATELAEASKIILNMKKNNAKIFLTFTSNMISSGLRGFFAQLCKFKIPSILVTTSGSIEEDIIKSFNGTFEISNFNEDDFMLHEKGKNRIGNILIHNSEYMKFEDEISKIFNIIYKKKNRLSSSELLYEIGSLLNDENSFLYQSSKNNIPIYCPSIADSSLGFQLFMFQQKHPDFIIDTIKDMERITLDLSFDEKKGLISLGGGVSKHYAMFSALLSGGFDYAVYMTTSHFSSGSLSGATTQEAKSWGKIKDDSQAATVIGDVSITFPLVMSNVLEKLKKENLLN